MKKRKMLAVFAACTMLAGLAGNIPVSAGTLVDNDDIELDMSRVSSFKWVGDDGKFVTISGKIKSEDSVYVLEPVYDGYTVKCISQISSRDTKYLVLPESCVLSISSAFTQCSSLKGIYIPAAMENMYDLDPDVAVVGERNTFADYFAEKNGNRFVTTGDNDLDGKTGVSDLEGQIDYMFGKQEFEDDLSEFAADMDHDGNLNIADLISLKSSILNGGSEPVTGSLASPVYKSSRTEATDESVSEYSKFAASFTDNVLLNTKDEKPGINKVYSPLSVYMAVSMLAECCDGESLDELMKVLGVSDMETLETVNQEIFDSFYSNQFDKYCRITNSIWINDGLRCEDGTIKTLADKFYVTSFQRNLGSQEGCNDISNWIYQNSSGKLKPVITPEDEAILKIINTVTFKEKWLSEFSPAVSGTFKGAGGDIACKFMKGEEHGTIIEDEDFVTYSKGLHDMYFMNFVLPAEGKTVSDIISDSETMTRVFTRKGGWTWNVKSTIPKFTSESKFDLIQTLKDSGVNKIFESAELSPLLNPERNNLSDPVVSGVTHEAVIDVNEKGCEASAYTMIEAVDVTVPKDYEFTVDRPFFYFISDYKGTPLFVGIVNDPTQK